MAIRDEQPFVGNIRLDSLDGDFRLIRRESHKSGASEAKVKDSEYRLEMWGESRNQIAERLYLKNK